MPHTMHGGAEVPTSDEARQLVMDAVNAGQARALKGQDIGNPYYDLWSATPHQGYTNWLDAPVSAIVEAMVRREHATGVFAWAVPDGMAIDTIRRVSPKGVVEVGAGAGYWARVLDEHGCPTLAFDLHLAPDTGLSWYRVQTAGVEVAGIHPARTLLLCWPPYADPMAADAVTAYWHAGGQTVVYVGEGADGCTGDDRFHDLIGDNSGWHDSDDDRPAPLFKITETCTVPQWAGIHDRLHVCRRIGDPT